MFKLDFICYKTLDALSLTATNDKATESAGQDQTARTCKLILLYTLQRINLCS